MTTLLQSTPESSQRVRMLPSRYSIDYEAVLSEAGALGAANATLFLKERLPSVWRDTYVRTIGRSRTSRISCGFGIARSNTSATFTPDWK